VITGAACCGKTTLLDLLGERGYQTVAETARQYFERELASGRKLAEIRAEGELLQRCIFDMQLTAERATRPNEVAFLDRALPDSLSFHRVLGLNPNHLLPDCFYHRYASVFILDRLPLQRETTLGPEDEDSSRFLDEWLVRDYSALGYDVMRVPALEPQERLVFVLEKLAEQSLI
jgi:predicted ATPase